MIDYSKYNLAEMQAIVTVLDDLTDEMSVEQGYENDFDIALYEFFRANTKANALIRQQARDHAAAEAEKVDRIKQAMAAGAPPAEAPAAADSPAPPDMFGWVGDAIDDLCAAGEVLGSDE